MTTAAQPAPGPTPPVHIFWDNSNIFVGARGAAAHPRHREGLLAASIRIHFEHLVQLARAGRPVARAVCVGSIPPNDEAAIRARLQEAGCTPELYPRAAGAREQGIDQSLQVHMLRTLVDGWRADRDPGVAVLLSGDGSGRELGAGFHADLERLHDFGWGVEVLSWEHSCSRQLREWVERVGAFVPLDAHYEAVTFVEGGRWGKQPNLTRSRPTAAPASPEEMEELAA